MCKKSYLQFSSITATTVYETSTLNINFACVLRGLNAYGLHLIDAILWKKLLLKSLPEDC